MSNEELHMCDVDRNAQMTFAMAVKKNYITGYISFPIYLAIACVDSQCSMCSVHLVCLSLTFSNAQNTNTGLCIFMNSV